MSALAIPEIETSTWNIDPVHSAAQFKVKHMMISNVKGEFTAIKGSLELDEQNIENSRVQAEIDASTINTRDPQRDTHLKSADFFDVEKFPTLSFRSTKVTHKGDGELAVAGELTIHGATHPATFSVEGPSEPAKDPWGNTRVGFSLSGEIEREKWGLGWNQALEAGGVLVGKKVKISIETQLVQSA